NRAIDGGAGTVLDLPLDPAKELKSLILKAIANDVVIGLMSLTLVR
ncbi:MAG: glycogen debranching protein, partial [Flavisolibacter sp.]|nr:glycogen debranching protein [Flavisolibacter sp.]